MSNLASAAHLRRATSQFPVSWYCDPRVFDAETRHLFPRAPGYVGHELMVPEPGDYYTLPVRDNAQVLVRNAAGVELLSNICRHRQAIMLKGRGNAQNIVCPIHRWTYDLKGELLGAPHFADKPCLNLARSGAQATGTACCSTARATSPPTSPRSSHGRARLLRLRAGPRRGARVQLQLEDLHRGLSRGLPRRAVPPGPRPVRHLRGPRAGSSALGSVQTVGINNRAGQAGLAQPTRKWHEAVLKLLRRRGAPARRDLAHVLPEHHGRVVPARAGGEHAGPARPWTCTINVVEFYYPEDIALFEPEFVAAEQAAYMETAVEDDEIAERMDAGRRRCSPQGRNESRALPVADGRRHAALPRVLSPRDGGRARAAGRLATRSISGTHGRRREAPLALGARRLVRPSVSSAGCSPCGWSPPGSPSRPWASASRSRPRASRPRSSCSGARSARW